MDPAKCCGPSRVGTSLSSSSFRPSRPCSPLPFTHTAPSFVTTSVWTCPQAATRTSDPQNTSSHPRTCTCRASRARQGGGTQLRQFTGLARVRAPAARQRRGICICICQDDWPQSVCRSLMQDWLPCVAIPVPQRGCPVERARPSPCLRFVRARVCASAGRLRRGNCTCQHNRSPVFPSLSVPLSLLPRPSVCHVCKKVDERCLVPVNTLPSDRLVLLLTLGMREY